LLSLLRLTPRQADWVAVGVVTAASVAGVAYAASVDQTLAVAPAVATLPLAALPLLWRRSRPGSALAVLAIAFVISTAFGWPMPHGLGLVFGSYAAALYGDRPVRTVAGVVAVAALLIGFATLIDAGSARALEHSAGLTFGYGAAWVFGDHTRIRRAYVAELSERALRLERERDGYARRATEEERTRIARELHDVVAHHVSVIAVQAGAARSTGSSDPQRLIQALGLIERTARSALGDLRILLGVLRKAEASPAPRNPRPTIEQLDELIGQARHAGIGLEVRRQGHAQPLPSLLDLCAYRVIQEGLTNVIKHAPAAQVHLLIRYEPHQLAITIVDNGPGASASSGVGHGLIGMRERVTLVGGQLQVGSALGGGFRIEACLPLDAAASMKQEAVPTGRWLSSA
jgi:signal transduction histidine kinase